MPLGRWYPGSRGDRPLWTSGPCRLLLVLVVTGVVAGGSASAGTTALARLALVGAASCGVPGVSSARAGARPLTVSPDGDGRADCARIVVDVRRPGTLELLVARRKPKPGVEHRVRLEVEPGRRTVAWHPTAETAQRTYVTRVSHVGRNGVRTTVRGPVVRVRMLATWFERASYPSGATARLHVDTGRGRVRYEVVDALTGRRVGPPRALAAGRAEEPRAVRLGRWRSGVYLFRFTAASGAQSTAALVVRSAGRPRERVAVVMPTFTWQAYNFLDADADGVGDTWYADAGHGTAALDRPYQFDGLPPHFEAYDLPFLRWLGTTGRRAEILSDEDIDAMKDGADLARRFDLLVFPGHHEYVTDHSYDVIERYRDLGGNLAFLTADALHWRIRLDGSTMTRLEAWRRIGRPEARLVGVQYRASDGGRARRPYVVRDVAAAPWLFVDTGLEVGDTFGPASGIEISGTASSSPRRTACSPRSLPSTGAGARHR